MPLSLYIPVQTFTPTAIENADARINVDIIEIHPSADVILVRRANGMVRVIDLDLADGHLSGAVGRLDSLGGGRDPGFRCRLVDHSRRKAIVRFERSVRDNEGFERKEDILWVCDTVEFIVQLKRS